MITKNFTISTEGLETGENAEQIVAVNYTSGDYNIEQLPFAAIIKVTGTTDAIVKLFGKFDNESLSDGLILTSGAEYGFDLLKDPIYKIVLDGVGGLHTTIQVSLFRYSKTKEDRVTGP